MGCQRIVIILYNSCRLGPMPVERSGMGLQGEYIGRVDDGEWPEDSGVHVPNHRRSAAD
jgi:hypothetical protein